MSVVLVELADTEYEFFPVLIGYKTVPYFIVAFTAL